MIPTPTGVIASRRTVPVLSGFSCASARRCVGFAFLYTTANFSSYAELTVTWNGRKWTSAVMSEGGFVSGADDYETGLFGVSCPSTRACVAVGGDSVGADSVDPIAAFWNGQTWAVQTLPQPAATQPASLVGVSCASATSCMAIGASGNNQAGILDAPFTERYQG